VSKLPSPIIHQPRWDLPVLLSVPHSGRDYPDWLVAMASAGKPALATLEDPFVDRLVWRALQRGCGFLSHRARTATSSATRISNSPNCQFPHRLVRLRGRVVMLSSGAIGQFETE